MEIDGGNDLSSLDERAKTRERACVGQLGKWQDEFIIWTEVDGLFYRRLERSAVARKIITPRRERTGRGRQRSAYRSRARSNLFSLRKSPRFTKSRGYL